MRGLETQLCETWEELEESLRGDYGPEAQRDAEMQYQQIQEQEQQAAAGSREQQFVEQAELLEKQLGRHLSNAEIQGLWADIPHDEAIPDLMETYGEQLGSRTYDERDREALTAEYAEQAFDRAEAGEDVFEPAGTE